MANGFSSAQISRFKRQAKKIARESSLIHAEALDRVATEQGFANWSLLSKARDPSVAHRKTISEATKASALTRYYLHGDIDEQDSSVYYCARCDLFCTPDHFSDMGLHRGQSHEMRYLDSIERWNERGTVWRAKWRRPEDAINLLAAKAVSINAAYQKSRSPFHRWLLTQLDRDDNVADLAVDVRADKAFPVTASSLQEIRSYLSMHGDHVLEALEQAWDEFSARHRER
ncbi:YozE family protein [Stenotrophomonas terrae]|uniref:YozE family protein n=1 Tax=Stenotrophomonas terrae TaxID=405446 RepID=UPI00320B0BB9